MNNISFTSNIKLVSADDFEKVVKSAKNIKSVDFPWTIKETVKGKSAFSCDIFDCTAVGIVDHDTEDVCLLHLTSDFFKKFKSVEKFINNKVNLLSDNLTAFVIGSKKNNINSPYSTKLFDKLVQFLDNNFIPYSKFKGGNYSNNIAYLGETDTWFVSNDVVDLTKSVYKKDKKQILNFLFDDVKIAQSDKFEIG